MLNRTGYKIAFVVLLFGCGCAPQEFAVSDVPVYTADDRDQLFMNEETIDIKFAETEHTFTIGRIKNGKLTFALPVNLTDAFFDDPKNLTIYNATPDLKIAIGIFSPDLYLFDTSKPQEHRLVYANKNGSFVSAGTKHRLRRGWNLLDTNNLSLSRISRSSQYKWVCGYETLPTQPASTEGDAWWNN